jgi:hydroxyacylglutathione hydrolase
LARRNPRNTTTRVADDIFVFDKTWGCRVYCLTGPRCGLIDAGFPVDTRTIRSHFAADSPGRPEILVATHCHLDHMGSMARLKKEFGCPVAASGEDAGVMEGTVPYTKFKLDPLRTAYYKLLSPLYPYEYVDVDTRLSDGDVIDLLGGLEVLLVPGHTPGSIMLYQREAGVLFTGDTIRNENGVLDGPPPQFTPDIDEAFRGIEQIVLPLEFETLLPGHGDPVTEKAHEAVERLVARREGCCDER